MEELFTTERAVGMMLMLALARARGLCAYTIWVARFEG